jgi:hypothetical protein
MTVVAGTHTVTADGVRRSGIYEALGLPRPAIGPLAGAERLMVHALRAPSRWPLSR